MKNAELSNMVKEFRFPKSFESNNDTFCSLSEKLLKYAKNVRINHLNLDLIRKKLFTFKELVKLNF